MELYSLIHLPRRNILIIENYRKYRGIYRHLRLIYLIIAIGKRRKKNVISLSVYLKINKICHFFNLDIYI